MVEGLAGLLDPESYAGGSLVLLVGQDRSKVRGYTKRNPPLQEVKRVVIGLTTPYTKTKKLQKC